MASIQENVEKAIADFDTIQAAIIESGVDVPYGTDTSAYGELVRQVAEQDGAYDRGYNAGYADATKIRDSMIDGSFSGALTSGVESVKNYGISNLPNLTSIILPSATVLNSTSVASNNKLQRVDLGAATRIDASAFAYSRALDALIIRTGAVCALTSDTAFRGTKIEAGTGYIYVPAALLEQYKVATNWAVFAAQFRTLEEVPA